MNLVRTFFVVSLAYLAPFAACLYLCFGSASVLLCHRWSGCIEDGAAYGYVYIVLAPFAFAIAVIAGFAAALFAVATMDRKQQRQDSKSDTTGL
jgi:hypothetical protein